MKNRTAAALPILLSFSFCACSLPLHQAAKSGDLPRLKAMLDKGADPNMRDNVMLNDYTPLYHAAIKGQVEAARLLIERGADVNKTYLGCWTALKDAIFFGQTEMVRLLLDAGADPKAGCSDRDAVQMARARGSTEMAELLERAVAEGPEARRLRVERAKAEKTARTTLESRLPSIESLERQGDEARAQGRPQEALERYSSALKETPPGTQKDAALRSKVIETARALETLPPVPEEARRHSERAQSFMRAASDPRGMALAAAELEKALTLAPWWADAYFNLGLVREKTGEAAAAIANFKLYLLAAPEAEDAEKVRRKMTDLEVRIELEKKAP